MPILSVFLELKKKSFGVFLILFFSFNSLHAMNVEEVYQELYQEHFSNKIIQKLYNKEYAIYKETLSHESFVNLKLLEYYSLLKDEKNYNRYLKEILYLINKSHKNKNITLFIISNMELANALKINNFKKSHQLMLKTSLLTKNHPIKSFKNETNGYLGDYNYSKLKNYKKAIYYWNKSYLFFLKNKSNERAASMLNNVAISYSKLGDFEKAYNLTLKALKSIKHKKNKDEVFMYHLLNNNLGGYLFKLNRYQEAIDKTVPFYNYCMQNEAIFTEIPTIANQLINIYKKQNNYTAINTIIYDLNRLMFLIKKPELKYNVCKVIYNYYLSKQDIKNINKFGKLLIIYQELKLKEFEKKSSFINEQMTNSAIASIEESFQKEKDIQQQRNITIFSIVSFILVLGGSFILYRRKNKQKEEIISEKEEKIEMIESDLFLEQQKQIQEKMLALQMNINLKNATASAFADKLKVLKRRKDLNPEEIIKELQAQINNLLNIDKKNAVIIEDNDSEEKRFNDYLRTNHPELTSQEIQLCNYYRMNLSAKEIATIEGITPGSARVYKNKLKNKLGLTQEDSVNQYLMSIYS